MIKLTYALYGMQTEADEIRICDAVRSAFLVSDVNVSFVCSTISLSLADDADIAAFSRSLQVYMETMGFRLSEEPTRKALNHPATPYDRTLSASEGKKSRSVPMVVFITCICCVLILTMLLTYAVAAGAFTAKLREIYNDQALQDQITQTPTPEDSSSGYNELSMVKQIFEALSVYELDDTQMMQQAIKAYAAASGDLYAEYYTAEEFAELTSENQGSFKGIGVSVVNTTTEINQFSYATLTIITVFSDSPAQEAGLLPGDVIFSVVDKDGNTITVDAVGHTQAINCVRGETGTHATITVLRPSGDDYRIMEFTIERRDIITTSVSGRVSSTDPTVGIVDITQFDLTTPTQFEQTMDTLIAAGCDKFVFDVRYNPGGDLQSIEAVLSMLLLEGDAMISTLDNAGGKRTDYVQVISYKGDYASCSIERSDIGKYRGYKYAVLTNEYTASAAELFTANLRDYDLATLVGTTTFGKGCMQSIYNLASFGLEGGIKLTTAWYLPPCGESYHDIGIAPDEGYDIPLDSTLIEQYENVYLIPDEADNQLIAAIQALIQ